MRIELLDNKDDYPSLHKLVFGVEIEAPKVVTVLKTDNYDTVGFLSGFWLENGVFYIEYAGILPTHRLKGYLRNISKMLEPDISYITAVENINVTVIKTLLSIGFIPMGSNYKGGKYFVELQRSANHG
jgi:hypothetical protein